MRNVGRKSRRASALPPRVSKSNSRYGALLSPVAHDESRPAGSNAIARPDCPNPLTTRQDAVPCPDWRSAAAASRHFWSVEERLAVAVADAGSVTFPSPHGHRTWLHHFVRSDPFPRPFAMAITRPGIMPFHFPPAIRVLRRSSSPRTPAGIEAGSPVQAVPEPTPSVNSSQCRFPPA